MFILKKHRHKLRVGEVHLFFKNITFFSDLDTFPDNIGSLSLLNPVSQVQTEETIFLRQLVFKTAASLTASTESTSYKQIGQ